MADEKITADNIWLWNPYIRDYFAQVLNGEYAVEDAREDLISLVKEFNDNPSSQDVENDKD